MTFWLSELGNVFSYHCEDLDLYLSSKELGNPKPKVSKVEVPGSSVTLDFTEAFGSVNYSNRTIQMSFLCLDPWEDQLDLQRQVRTTLHGKRANITFDDDEDIFFTGRVSVNSWTYYQGAGRVQMSVDADPWCYKFNKKTTPALSSTDQYFVLPNNGLRPTAPYIYMESAVGITIGETYRTVSVALSGTQLAWLTLPTGNTTIKIKGTNGITATFAIPEVYL